jgi:hypothetical protein
MDSLKNYIDLNYNEFSNLGCSEIIECTLDEFDSEEISYLKLNERFDYKGICIYYVERDNNVWIENMDS